MRILVKFKISKVTISWYKKELLLNKYIKIRNPIQSILGLAELMLSNKKLASGHINDLVKIIIKNAKKIKFLTGNILEVARIDSQLLTLQKNLIL